MLLLLNSLAHFLVDGLSISVLFGCLSGGIDIATAVIIYNSLAFSTQCVVGLVTDATGRWEWLCFGGLLAVLCGFIIPMPYAARLCFVGLGNSLFHVTAGSMTLRDSGGKAARLGVFVAPGAFGVTLGTLWPALGPTFAALLAICACAMLRYAICDKTARFVPERTGKSGFPVFAVVLLTLAVAVRAVGGSAVSFPWKNTAAMSILMTAFVFAGKAAGGFVCDRLGSTKSAWLSIPISALIVVFCSNLLLPSLIGQFLLNLSMPITLYLIYKSMPDSPGFAFGLAASALWPGTIVGQMFRLTGPALWLCVIISFIFGLGAILYADIKLRRTKE